MFNNNPAVKGKIQNSLISFSQLIIVLGGVYNERHKSVLGKCFPHCDHNSKYLVI